MHDYLKSMFGDFERDIACIRFRTEKEKDIFLYNYQKFKFCILLTSLNFTDEGVSRCTVSDDDGLDEQEE